MQRLIKGLLVGMATLVAAASASAFNVNMTTTYAGQPLDVGDTITVELFLDADAIGIQLMAVSVMWDIGEFAFVPETNVEQGVPTYILYGGSGMLMSSLEMQQNPWQIWPGLKPPGREVVNINWADPTISTGTFVTGLGIKIAQVTLQVTDTTDGAATIELTSSETFNVFQVSAAVIPLPVSGTPIAVTLPEPTSAALSLAALGTLYGVYAVRKRARRS